MYSIGHSPSRNRFEAEHRVFPGGFNPSLAEPRAQQRHGPSCLLNGDRYYSYEAAIARSRTMGSVTVQFVTKDGRAQEPRSCEGVIGVANAIPTDFKGGYVTIRANPIHVHDPKPKRRHSWDW